MENSGEIIWKDQVGSQNMSLQPSSSSNQKFNALERVDEFNPQNKKQKNKTKQQEQQKTSPDSTKDGRAWHVDAPVNKHMP